MQSSVNEQRTLLPVHAVRRQLVRYLSDTSLSTWIIVGETACGKSTQIPQIIYESHINGGRVIGCTQPRRVAAVSIATYVAQEKKSGLGQLVGYNVRFDNVTSEKTRIKYLTDGMLLREALLDRWLKNYSWVILDEIHERTVHTDVLLGVVKAAQKSRADTNHPLKVILMSATMDVDKFSSYFGDTPVLYIEGRQFPVDVYYSPESYDDYSFNALVAVCQLNKEKPHTDSFLVFLTGQEEIDSFCNELKMLSKASNDDDMPTKLHVAPLYAHLPLDLQLQAIRDPPPGLRKVVVSTNIAETSITIPGITVVIDTGRVKMKQYNANGQLDILKVHYISQAQAVQRAGRAGRLQAGACYRLYTDAKFSSMPPLQKAEILRCNLLSVCLELLAIGITNIASFDFVDKPSAENIQSALDQLVWLGAVDEHDQNKLTDDGRIMARFPLDPTLSKALLSAVSMGCLKEALIVVSMLSVDSVFHAAQNSDHERRHAIFRSDEGDHVTLLNVYNAYNNCQNNKKQWCFDHRLDYRNLHQAEKILKQLTEIAQRLGWVLETHDDDTEPLRTSLASGLFFKSAILQSDQSYKAAFSNRAVYIHPSSALFAHKSSGKSQPHCVVYTELVVSTKCYMRLISVIDIEDLIQTVPGDLRWRFSDSTMFRSSKPLNGFHHKQ